MMIVGPWIAARRSRWAGWVAGAALLLGLGTMVPAARGQAAALDVKASGKKTFYVDDRAGNNQVSVFSQSTLEDFTTVCNRVSGQCAVDPKNVQDFRGRFSLRIDDLRTGIELRDSHLRSPDWFDSAKFPEVVIEITSVEDAKKAEGNTAAMTLVGTCALHGQTKPVKIPATLTYLDESPITMKRVKGDLIRIRAAFDIKLSDYGVTGPKGTETIGLKVSDTLNIKVSVFGSTEPPAEALKTDKPAGTNEPTTQPKAPPPPPRK